MDICKYCQHDITTTIYPSKYHPAKDWKHWGEKGGKCHRIKDGEPCGCNRAVPL